MPLKTSIIEKKISDKSPSVNREMSLPPAGSKISGKTPSPGGEIPLKTSVTGQQLSDKSLSFNRGISGTVPGTEKKQAPRTSLLPKERTLAHIAALKREVPRIEEPPPEDDDDLDDFSDEHDVPCDEYVEYKDSEEVLPEFTFIIEKKGIIARLKDIIMKWFGKK